MFYSSYVSGTYIERTRLPKSSILTFCLKESTLQKKKSTENQNSLQEVTKIWRREGTGQVVSVNRNRAGQMADCVGVLVTGGQEKSGQHMPRPEWLLGPPSGPWFSWGISGNQISSYEENSQI